MFSLGLWACAVVHCAHLIFVQIFKSPYFLCLWVSNLVGLGSGIYVVNKFGCVCLSCVCV